MRAQVGPASRDLVTVEKYDAFLKVQEAAIVGYFEKESDLKATYLKYANQQREKLRFGHSSDPAVLGKVGETDAIYLFRAPQLSNKFESSSVKFTGKSSSELSEFVKKNL
jgi:protein disulfide isomerase family A protein 3